MNACMVNDLDGPQPSPIDPAMVDNMLGHADLARLHKTDGRDQTTLKLGCVE